ncbi:helicase C-terminal domain-containing protein [Saccharolobus caldissimus]|uniref:DEAD/DEAH box helicase n=1 Tax=Saccharolobus caldissimus TaxID=1702097 RepID=A0AAQ4CNT8_9CREN|nr:helicase C-terminal domain-containing protein [Saccharolobus caldissimus]BDB97469.1 DEAD/DEAH box helicase [Saccharolobus caldissimus]
MSIMLREWQKEYLNTAIEHLRTERTLLLQAPTGSGKTLFALKASLSVGGTIIYLTRTHNEFTSVKREADRLGLKVAFLFGKASVCPFAQGNEDPEEIDCKSCKLNGKVKDMGNLSPSQIIAEAKRASEYCPYQSLKAKIGNANIVASSYLYFFLPNLRRSILKEIEDKNIIVIVDEAHNLLFSDEWFKRRIGRKTLKNALEELDIVRKESRISTDKAKEYLSVLYDFINKLDEGSGCKQLPLSPQPSKEALDQLVKAMKTYVNLIKGPIKRSSLRSVVNFFSEEGEVYNCNGSLVVVPNKTWDKISSALRSAKYVILMSGTLPELGITGYRINVNIKMGRAEWYYCNNLTSKAKVRSSEAPKYAEMLKRIYKLSESNVLAFFPNYEFKNLVKGNIRDIPVLEEDKRGVTHEEILELMRNGKYLVLLVMRAKESEGVEFRFENKNLFDSVILAGLPYPDITDSIVTNRIKRIAELTRRSEEEVAKELTLITIKQTIGRAFRDPNDFVRIYLCDSRYKEYFSDLGLTEKEIKLFV